MIIVEILNKYRLAPVQHMLTSWHNVCSFIATYEVCGLSCTSRAFRLVHKVQKAPSETGETGWYNFNNWKGFITAIKKKSKLKNWKYDFLFVHHAMGWADLPDWNDDKPI